MTTIDTLIDDFAFLDDWEDRYTLLIELGRALPPLSEAEHCPDNLVRGCLSQVWLVIDPQADGRHCIRADSDSVIVKGLAALLDLIYSGKTEAERSAVDIQAIFRKLGLEQHLSPNRRNGFFAMVGRIKALVDQEQKNPPG